MQKHCCTVCSLGMHSPFEMSGLLQVKMMSYTPSKVWPYACKELCYNQRLLADFFKELDFCTFSYVLHYCFG